MDARELFVKSLTRIVDKNAPCDRPKIVHQTSFNDIIWGPIGHTTYYCPTVEEYNEFKNLTWDGHSRGPIEFTDCHRCTYRVKNTVSLQSD